MANARDGDDGLRPRANERGDEALLGADDAVLNRLRRAPAGDVQALLDAIAALADDDE